MRRAKGFSLVEMMVAITLGLLVTGALISAVLGVSGSSRTSTGVGAVGDGGRIALDLLQQAVRSAGYMACNTTARQASLLPSGPGPDPLNYDYTDPLGGYEAVGTGPGAAAPVVIATPPVTPSNDVASWVTTGGGNLNALLNNNAVAGSDVLVVQSTLTGAPVTAVTPAGSSALTIVKAADAASFTAGQIGVVSDCVTSVVFQIASVAGGTVDTVQTIPGRYAAGAQLGVADTTVFYIGKGTDGDGALYALDAGGTGTLPAPSVANELVPDIENMQVLYGITTSALPEVNQYVTADQVTALGATSDFNSVVAVKIAVLAASAPGAVPLPAAASTYTLLGTPVQAPIDTRMRKVFEITVTARNSTT
jgi:type IV pilus assembly protein PilW